MIPEHSRTRPLGAGDPLFATAGTGMRDGARDKSLEARRTRSCEYSGPPSGRDGRATTASLERSGNNQSAFRYQGRRRRRAYRVLVHGPSAPTIVFSARPRGDTRPTAVGRTRLSTTSTSPRRRSSRSSPNPHGRTYHCRGLVLGYVQSGKTTNFTAVIAKAADAGYRFFIVLSGIHDALRQQTQDG